MVNINLQALSAQNKRVLFINALQVLLAIITLGLAAGAHSVDESASNYTVVVCLFAIGTSLVLAWGSVSPPNSRILVALLLVWHVVLMILWAAVVGIIWSDYHGRASGTSAHPILLAAGVFSIFDFLLWFATVVTGCLGFCRGGKAGKWRAGLDGEYL